MVKHSHILPLIFGFFIIYIGIIILLNNIGFHIHGGSIFSLFFIFIGYLFLKKQKKVPGFVFVIFGSLILLEAWFGIDIGEIIGFFIAVGFIYLGYRMIRKRDRHVCQKQTKSSFACHENIQSNSYRILTPQRNHSLIGNCILTGSRWELTDMDIWQGIGEVKIDLSRASILEQKSTIIINGWIGDVDIYIPYDLDITIIARVGVGEIDIFGNKEGGLNRSTAVETTGYRTAVKRVEVIINLFVGDIDVNYL